MTLSGLPAGLAGHSEREIASLLPHLTPAERQKLRELLGMLPPSPKPVPVWEPLPGPQAEAFNSKADIIGYGGAAGGGKSDLLLGMAFRKQKNSIIFRREATQLIALYRRMFQIAGTMNGWNKQDKIFNLGDRIIEFGSCPNPDDELKYQGRPHDFIGFDEVTHFNERVVRFLMGWLRTTDPNQQCRVVMTFNPPTTSEGRWVIDFFAPWLDRRHPNPAAPGELRWFITSEGKDIELPNGDLITLPNGQTVRPMSRTFYPSSVQDNPYLYETGYMDRLNAMPEPLRSQLMYGDFDAGVKDDVWQVIPTKWIEEAMARWTKPAARPRIYSVGVDVGRGTDKTVYAAMTKEWWVDELKIMPHDLSPDGPTTAAWIMANNLDFAPIHIDVIGIGASPYDFLRRARQEVYGINVAASTGEKDRTGVMSFSNLRSLLWWRLREALDPSNNTGIQLPPDKELATELATPKWSLKGRTVYVESREDIVRRIGRSPDRASALALAAIRTPPDPRLEAARGLAEPFTVATGGIVDYDPLDGL